MGVVLRQAMLIAVKDTRIFFRDKFAVGFAFLFPFLFVIGFSLALRGQGPEDEPLRLVLATQEGTDGVSAQLIQGFADEGGAGDLTVMTYDEALAATERRRACGIRVISAGVQPESDERSSDDVWMSWSETGRPKRRRLCKASRGRWRLSCRRAPWRSARLVGCRV